MLKSLQAFVFICGLMCVISLTNCADVFAQTAALDCSFDDDGIVLTDMGGDELARDAAVYTSGSHAGKTVVVGTAGSSDFGIARYNIVCQIEKYHEQHRNCHQNQGRM